MTRAALWLLILMLAPFVALAQDESGTPLTVESLECRGNTHTSCRFILGQVYLAAGDRLDEEEIQNAKLRLLWLRNFESVSIYLEKGSSRGRARVIVEVAEARPVGTELTGGLESLNGNLTQVIAGRWTDYNLFGNGKVLNLSASLIVPLDGEQLSERVAQLSYVDPHLFDSKRNFLSAGLSYVDLDRNRDNGDFFRIDQMAVDMTLGHRLWDFSYVTAGYQYRPTSDRNWSVRDNDGVLEAHKENGHSSLLLGYGWNSEDNQFFPTRGSAMQLTVASDYGRNDDDVGFFYRKTWRTSGGSVWTAGYEAPHDLTLRFARPLKPWGDLRQARGYVQFTGGETGYDSSGTTILSAGLTVGVRFDSRAFGIVSLFVFGSREWTQ